MADPKSKAAITDPNPVRDSGVEEQVRLLAYEFYEQRGKEDGRDVEDWLRAEEEIKRPIRTAAA